MTRRKVTDPDSIHPDPVFQSELVAKFVNMIMEDGKKNTAENIVYEALEIVSGEIDEEPVEVFNQVIENVKPSLEVRSRRVGGSTYQVPIEVPDKRGQSLAMRWIIDFSKQRGEKTMRVKLANEFLDAYNRQGGAFNKKEEVHKMAEANQAFAHFRW